MDQIQIGDILDLQKGRMVYIGHGKADAQEYIDGKFVTTHPGVALTDKQIEAWHQIKAKQAAASSTRTSSTL